MPNLGIPELIILAILAVPTVAIFYFGKELYRYLRLKNEEMEREQSKK